jgi:hypothetical protein
MALCLFPFEGAMRLPRRHFMFLKYRSIHGALNPERVPSTMHPGQSMGLRYGSGEL